MFDVGGGEILLIVLAILLLFGPRKIPEIASMVGNGMRKVRRAQDEFTSHLRDISTQLETAESFERRLAGFAKVTLGVGESALVEVALEPLAFKRFNGGWQDPVGNRIITLAESAFEQGSSIIV